MRGEDVPSAPSPVRSGAPSQPGACCRCPAPSPRPAACPGHGDRCRSASSCRRSSTPRAGASCARWPGWPRRSGSTRCGWVTITSTATSEGRAGRGKRGRSWRPWPRSPRPSRWVRWWPPPASISPPCWPSSRPPSTRSAAAASSWAWGPAGTRPSTAPSASPSTSASRASRRPSPSSAPCCVTAPSTSRVASTRRATASCCRAGRVRVGRR